MYFKISKKEFYNALSAVSRAISSNSPIPSLSGIKIEVFNNEIYLTGSSSDISIKKRISNTEEETILNVIEEGSIVIEAKYILEIVRKIDAVEIEVEIIDGSLTRISGQSAEFKINGMKASEYPALDFSKPERTFTINADVLLKVINQTSFATSDKETRPVLTGVNFKAVDNRLECVATDSYRLAKKVIDVNGIDDFNITIPAKSLAEIAKSIERESDIEIAVSDKKIQVYIENTTVQSRLIEGVYPETSKLIPNVFDHELVIDSRDMLNAIDRASFIKNDGISIVKLSASSNEIIISSKSQEVGSSFEKISAMSYTGDELEISFSGRYVYDAIKVLNCSEIKISFSGHMKPFIVRNVNDDSIVQLILPVRTYS